MGYALGIDFGGTKILAGVVDTHTGAVLSTAKQRTRSDDGIDHSLDRLLAVAREALEASGKHVTCAAIGVAGQVDVKKGVLERAPNLPDDLLGTAIVDSVRKHLSVPVSLFNDVAAAAAGEAAFGSGQDQPDFVCVFVGTGIGGAIYQHGKPYGGATNTAGEVGHMIIDYDGRLCGCGGKGHLEAYASRSAIVRSILAAMKQGRKTMLEEVDTKPNPDDPAHSPIRSKALARAIDVNDELTLEMIDDGARFLAAGLVSIINAYNPPLIILGGGVIDAVDRLFERAAALARHEALLVPRRHVTIIKAALGDNSGVVGASVLAHRHA